MTKLPKILLPIILATANPASAATFVWDASTDAGYQNGNGNWADAHWVLQNDGGTKLRTFTAGNDAFFGGNTGIEGASPAGDYTVTVNGTQAVGANVLQIGSSVANYTITGGTLQSTNPKAFTLSVQAGTFTINSELAGEGAVRFNPSDGATLIVGGKNSFSGVSEIRGAPGGTVKLTGAALGSSSGVTFFNGATLDLNGLSYGGKRLNWGAPGTGTLVNTSRKAATWGHFKGNSAAVTGGSTFVLGGKSDLTVNGAIFGAGAVTKNDAGIVALLGNSSYAGTTTVNEGTLLIHGAHSGTAAVTVETGAAIGGTGSIAGSLVLAEGAWFAFSERNTLTVNGAAVDLGNLGVGNIKGLDANTPMGTYTLIAGSAAFDFSEVQNLGEANAKDLGKGKRAYFSQHGLVLHVSQQ